jgi:hypothetical protein
MVNIDHKFKSVFIKFSSDLAGIRGILNGADYNSGVNQTIISISNSAMAIAYNLEKEILPVATELFKIRDDYHIFCDQLMAIKALNPLVADDLIDLVKKAKLDLNSAITTFGRAESNEQTI